MASWSQKYHGVDVAEWTDMRKYDEDDDTEWYQLEEKKLAEEYGGNFIRVKSTKQGRVGYFCVLCSVEANARISIGAHCAGMKHLKKKDLWQKEQKGDDSGSKEEDDEYPTGPLKIWIPKEQPDPLPPATKRMAIQKKRIERPPYRERREIPDGPPYLRWNDRDDYRDPPEPQKLYPPATQGYWEQHESRLKSPKLPKSQDDYRDPPEPRKRYPPATQEYWEQHESQPKPPKLELKQSPAGALLQKLSECAIKTEEDSKLALNVIIALNKSLKEFYQSKKDLKVSDLLMESELKLCTVKALVVSGKFEEQRTIQAPPTSLLLSQNYATNSNFPQSSGLPFGTSSHPPPPPSFPSASFSYMSRTPFH